MSQNGGLRGAQCLKCPSWLEHFLKDGECPEDCMELGKALDCCLDSCSCCDNCGNCFQKSPLLEFIKDFSMSTIVFFFHVLFNGTLGLFVDFGNFKYLEGAGKNRTPEMKYIFGIEIIVLIIIGALSLISNSHTYLLVVCVVFLFFLGAEFSVLICNEDEDESCCLGVGAMICTIVASFFTLAFCYVKLAISLHSDSDDSSLSVILTMFYILIVFHFQKDHSLVLVKNGSIGREYKDQMTQFTSWGNVLVLMHLVQVLYWAANKDSDCMVEESFVTYTTVISGIVLCLRHFCLLPRDSQTSTLSSFFFFLPLLDFLLTGIHLSVKFQQQSCDVVLGLFTLARLVWGLFGIYTSQHVFPLTDFLANTQYAGNSDLSYFVRLLGLFTSPLRVVFLIFVGIFRGFLQFAHIIMETIHWLFFPLSCWNGDLEAKHANWSSQAGFQNDPEESKRKDIEFILFGTVFWLLVAQFPQFVRLDSKKNTFTIVLMNLSELVLVIVGSRFQSRLASKDANGEDKMFASCVTAMQLRSFGELLLVLTVISLFVSLAKDVDSDTWPWQECIMFLITFFCVVIFMLTPYIWDTHRRVIRTMYPQWDIQNKDALVTVLLTLLETWDLKDSGSTTWVCGVVFTIMLMLMQWVASFLLIDSYDLFGEHADQKCWINNQLQDGWEKPLLRIVGLWLDFVAFFGSIPCLFIALSLGFHNFSGHTLTFFILKVITFGRACWLSYTYFRRGAGWEEECQNRRINTTQTGV